MADQDNFLQQLETIDKLLGLDPKRVAIEKEKQDTVERNQAHAEQAFLSQLSKTNKKRGRPTGRKKRSFSGKGYSYVLVNGKQVLEHRHIMEQHLGRKLLKHEAVFFKDGNRENLSIENLQLGFRPGAHTEVECPHCNKDIFKT